MIISALRTCCGAALSVCLLAAPGLAQHAPAVEALLDALMIDETISVMQDEGTAYGEDIAAQMIPDVAPRSWARRLTEIYAPERLYETLADGFAEALSPDEIEPLVDYLSRADIREILTLEISARRALLDPDLEAAARARFLQMEGEGVRLLEQVEAIIDDSDLVEANVAGALNADMMFYRGLVEGGALEMTEGEMLTEVWAQEQALREASREWLEPFLMMAYRPLDPDLLDSYVAFWRTDDGKRLNRAVFEAFDAMYEDISYRLGRAVAREMTSEKL